MSKFILHERAFHPDKNFGMGGFYFKGDNRGFSHKFDVNRITCRVGGYWEIDTVARTVKEVDVYSDPSTAPWGTSSDYAEPETKPTGEILTQRVSPLIEDGMQMVALRVHTRGKNHAFTSSPGLNNWVVPDLDVTVHFQMNIDRYRKRIHIVSTLLGDGFPNTEVFIIDSAGTELMLNTHHRIGHAAGQLIGNHGHLLAGTELTIDCDDSANFTGPIKARRCVDFKPFDHDLLGEAGTTDFSIASWNRMHTGRPPTDKGLFGIDTDDDLPVPGRGHEYPRDGWFRVDDFFDEPKEHDLPDWNH